MSDLTQTQKPLIILAEDDEGVAALSQAVLSSKYEVRHYPNGKEALNALIALKDEIGAGRNVILVTDNTMPEMTGVELMKELVNHKITVPTVFATTEKEALEGVTFLVDAFLHKPYRPADLTAAVDKAVKHYETLPKPAHAEEEKSRKVDRSIDPGTIKH